MFGSTPIRYLTPSEEFYATAENFIGMTLTLHGPVDVGAMSQAFETLLQVHPAHAGHLDRPGADGRHQIMVDDYEHQGMWVEKLGETPAQRLPDQSEALLNLRLRVGADRSELTLYTHHALADAHHQFALLEKLFGWYTDIVGGVGVGPVVTEPIPESLEAVLTERGIEKLQRFGLSATSRRCSPTSCRPRIETREPVHGRLGCRRRPAGSAIRRAAICSTCARPAGSVSTRWWPRRSCWRSGISAIPHICPSRTCTRSICASS